MHKCKRLLIFASSTTSSLSCYQSLVTSSRLLYGKHRNRSFEFHKLRDQGKVPDAPVNIEKQKIPITRNEAYLLLQHCVHRKDLECGRQSKCLLIHSGLGSISVLGDHLIRLFSYHGSLVEANQAFDDVSEPTSYTWAAVIWANVNLGQTVKAIDLYHEMQWHGTMSDRHIYVSLLRGCTIRESLFEGRIVHDQIIKIGLQSDIVVGSALVHMYSTCGSLGDACNIFDNLLNRDVVLWNTMITGYTRHEEGLLAMECLEKMQQDGIKPNDVTFLAILKACAITGAIEHGRLIHVKFIEKETKLGTAWNTLVDMYAKCGNIEEAHAVFSRLPDSDVVAWNALIAGYVQSGDGVIAIECFENMQREGTKVDEVTFSSILKACGSIGALERGRVIHEQMITSRMQLNDIVMCTLLDMYARCGSLEEACNVFDELPHRTLILWNAMIVGYIQLEEGTLALLAFEEMQEKGIKPNHVTFLILLKACASLGVIEKGRLIHDKIFKAGMDSEAISSTLIDMYAKCGSLKDAYKIFDKIPHPDVVAWGTMIAAYAQHGEVHLALECYKKMLQMCVMPNEVVFTSVIVACSRSGLVDEGTWYFHSMREYHRLVPTTTHCTTLVDLLSRGGYLTQAEALLRAAAQTNIMGWKTLLNACKMLGNFEVGRHCFNEIVILDSYCAAGYVLMSNIYAEDYDWKDDLFLTQFCTFGQ